MPDLIESTDEFLSSPNEILTRKEASPDAFPTIYRTSVVDSFQTDLATLLAYAQGSVWTVNYLNGVKGTDDGTANAGSNQVPVYEQYTAINNFELLVQSPLTPSFDAEKGEMTVKGTAIVYPYMYPIYGDHFFADAGNGREAIFRLTGSPNRLTDFKESLHEIEYVLVDYSDVAVTFKQQILDKVVKNLFFKKGMLTSGKFPLLVEEDSVNYDEMQRWPGKLARRMLSSFVDMETGSFVIPANDGAKRYDSYARQFVSTIFSMSDAPELSNLAIIDAGDRLVNTQQTLWTMLDNFELDDLDIIAREIWLLRRNMFSSYPVVRNIAYTTYAYATFIKNKVPLSDDLVDDTVGIPIWDIPDTPRVYPGIEGYSFSLLDDQQQTIVIVPPAIHPVNKDAYYVLSEAFYTQTEADMSVLERLLMSALKRQTIEAKYVLALCKDVQNWDALDQFYYIPILVLLLRYSSSRF